MTVLLRNKKSPDVIKEKIIGYMEVYFSKLTIYVSKITKLTSSL